MAILPSTDIYLIILFLGLAYFILSAFFNLEVLLGHYSLGVPYALVGWGIIGLLTMKEPTSFLLGFLVIWISISTIYLFLTSYTSSYEKYYLKPGVVTIPIKPDKFGEIKISRDGGFDFLQAKASNLVKPIIKGETVRIIELEGTKAIVSIDYTEIELENTFSKWYNRMAGLIRLLTIKSKYSGVCTVCYGNVKGSRDAVKCPSCDSIAHFDHLKEWVDMKSSCPNCRSKLKVEGSKILLVKTQS